MTKLTRKVDYVVTNFGTIFAEELPAIIVKTLKEDPYLLPWWRFAERRRRLIRWELAMEIAEETVRNRWQEHG